MFQSTGWLTSHVQSYITMLRNLKIFKDSCWSKHVLNKQNEVEKVDEHESKWQPIYQYMNIIILNLLNTIYYVLFLKIHRHSNWWSVKLECDISRDIANINCYVCVWTYVYFKTVKSSYTHIYRLHNKYLDWFVVW